MLIYNNETFRNLVEQVQYLSDFHKANQALASWGIKIVGQLTSAENLPVDYTGDYGDAYAIGEEAPFSFYIWTRPSIDQATAYWFPFGEISIVGPQGPIGPTGPTGPEGVSSKWYTTMPTNPNENDLLLNSNGQVLQYINNLWVPVINITGPQGVQGIQGPIGPVGPEGPVGPKGATGDVGGFISIAGILANADQLPIPSQLDNLTLAYLVGAAEPYDLYVQIGETPETATWNNMGPLNVATMITINGQFQNVWDADTKLDKITTTGANRVYMVSGQGVQGALNYGPTPVANWMPLYEPGQNGALQVGPPTKPVHATPKQYVDNMWDKIYPVGSIYMNVNSVDPSVLFGGTWEQLKDKFLLASGDIYANGSEGGSADAIVVSHTHGLSSGGRVLGINVDEQYSETAEGFAQAAEGSGLWANNEKAVTDISSTGMSGVGKNMPPYLAVNVWKRTA